MQILDDDCYVCQDCLMIIANDDDSGIEDEERVKEVREAVYAGPADWVCGDSEKDMEFSRRCCGCCNNALSGSRHHAVLLFA